MARCMPPRVRSSRSSISAPRSWSSIAQVAAERRLELKTVEASMDDLSMFATGEFDIVIQPVSTCYLPEIGPVYREVARVTASGGLYISQHKSPTSLQADIQASTRGYELIEPYYRSGPLPPVAGSPHREEGTLEYLHRWEEIFGLMCRAGFVIEDVVEPLHATPDASPGSFAHRSRYVAPYVRIKARRDWLSGKHAHQARETCGLRRIGALICEQGQVIRGKST